MVFKNKAIIILMFSSFFASGQSADIPVLLQTIQKSALMNTMTFIYDKNNIVYDSSIIYKGIPGEMSSYIIKTLDFQPEQGLFELYLRLFGKMPTEALIQGLKQYDFLLRDTVKLSHTPIKHFVSFLVGRNKEGQVVVIGDANNNYDFSDDKSFLFDSSVNNADMLNRKLFTGINNFRYQYVYNGNIIDASVFLGMSIKNTSIRYVDPLEQELFLTVSLEEYKLGVLKIDSVSRNFKLVLSRFPVPFFNHSNSKIFLEENDENKYFVIGDSIQLGYKKYRIKDIAKSGDTLYLSYMSGNNISQGVYPGDHAYNIISKDLVTNARFNLSKLTNRFILIDFWGSWCDPCLKAIPDLINIQKKYNKRLQIVSIAVDDQEKINLIRKIIKEKKMQWLHLFENIKDTSKKSIAVRYKVDYYPLQLVIDPKGKIIYRSTPDSKLTQNILDSLLKL